MPHPQEQPGDMFEQLAVILYEGDAHVGAYMQAEDAFIEGAENHCMGYNSRLIHVGCPVPIPSQWYWDADRFDDSAP